MDSTTNTNFTGGFGSFDMSPREDWNSFNDDNPESLEYEPAYPLQVRQFFKSAVGRSSLTTPPSHKPDDTNLAVMDLPPEILCQVFEHIIAPFKEYYDDNLVPQYFRGRGIRFQLVESSFFHESPSPTDNLTVTGEASIRNLNQMVATRQAVDPLATYREIQSGTAETIPDGWLQSEGVAQELEQLSWDEDEMSEEDTDDYSDSDESSDDELTDEDTANNGEEAAAFVPRASNRRLALDRDPICDPDGFKLAFLATNRRDGEGPTQ